MDVFKRMRGFEGIDKGNLVTVNEKEITMGHNLPVNKEQCKLDIIKYSFSQPVVNT